MNNVEFYNLSLDPYIRGRMSEALSDALLRDIGAVAP